MKRLCLILVLVLLATAVLSGCGRGADRAAAEAVADSFFEYIKNKDFEQAMQLYSPEFFEQTARDDWLQALTTVNAELGDLQTYELDWWGIRTYSGPGGRGVYYDFKYKVRYSRYPATEMLALCKASGDGEWKILGHNINSMGLVKE